MDRSNIMERSMAQPFVQRAPELNMRHRPIVDDVSCLRQQTLRVRCSDVVLTRFVFQSSVVSVNYVDHVLFVIAAQR